MPSVLVIGAGPAGLTAAHELACRGYDVTVVDAGPRERAGGKCASQFVQHPTYGTLAGEHGFRFFPGFYRHAPDIMARIPRDHSTANPADALSAYEDSVADELVPSETIGIARPNRPLEAIGLDPVGLNNAPAFARFLWRTLMDLPLLDALRVGRHYLRFISSCDERRLASWDNVSFWEFVEAAKCSKQAQQFLRSRPLLLVAMDAMQGSARTLLNTLFLVNTEWTHEQASQRVLAGPTSDVWIRPWVAWLERLGVAFRFGEPVEALGFDAHAKVITGATVGGETITADHYVLAVPIERALPLFSDAMAEAAPSIAAVLPTDLNATLGTMSGVQLFLNRPIDLHHGHVGFVDSPWCLTAVAQHQYWRPERLACYVGAGENKISGILSLCVTAWDREAGAVTGATVPNATREQILDEIVHQLGVCELGEGEQLIHADDVLAMHIDDHVRLGPEGEIGGRLLIHPPGFYGRRPLPVVDGISNLFLAGDWVRSQVDLATMEGAIETARGAVNGILVHDASVAPRCPTFDLFAIYEPQWIRRRKSIDRVLFGMGLGALPLGDDHAAVADEAELVAGLTGYDVFINDTLEQAANQPGVVLPPDLQ